MNRFKSIAVALACIIGLSLMGCSSGEQSLDDSSLNKIIDWQQREGLCSTIEEGINGSLSDLDRAGVLDVVTGFIYEQEQPQYQADSDDYWQTSCQTRATMQGDCEDIAGYWYARLREQAWFDDVQLSMVWITYDGQSGRKGHMLLRIQTLSQPIWISNNVVLGNLNQYNNKNMRVEYEFDLWSVWS